MEFGGGEAVDFVLALVAGVGVGRWEIELERLERPVRSGFLEDASGGESWSRVEGRCDAGPDAGEECDDIEPSWMLDV